MKTVLCLLCLLALLTARQTRADSTPADVDALKKENAALRQRLEKVESELGEIKQLLQPRAPVAAFTPAETERLKLLAQLKDKPAHASLDLKFYGYVKLDAAHDDSRANLGNFARWVESESPTEHDDQFTMTANQTRLGVDITGPETGALRTTGKVEIDFYGAGVAENKPEPLLRHAYLNVAWPDYDFSLLAGQTSDIISPLWMPTVNYTVGWWQGNIGYRRPQIRLTKGFKIADDWSAKLEVGPTRTITGRKYVFTSSTDPDSGDDSGFPTTQGRASLSFPVGGKRHGTVGVSGHWGAEDQHVTAPDDHREVHTWSANVDLRLPVTDWLLLQAEGFLGKNLDSYLGGIGQGIEPTTHQAVADRGGWVAASLGPWSKWSFNIGTGFDDPEDSDLLAATARVFNYVAFGNVQYAFTSNLQLAFELSYLRTNYKAAPHGDDIREQAAIIYKF